MAITFTTGDGKQQPTFGPWPAGEYLVRIVDAKEKTSSNGNPMIELRVRVVQDGDVKGGGIFDYLVFSDGAKWKVDAFLQAANKWPGENQPVDIDAADLVGLEITAKLRVGKDREGNKKNEVETYVVNEGF